MLEEDLDGQNAGIQVEICSALQHVARHTLFMLLPLSDTPIYSC